jgi:transcriptional regulator with GAF, ATPase, and Fis domain
MKTAKNVLIDNVAVRRRIAGDTSVRLTPAERRRAIRVLHRNGLPDAEMAERLGIPVTSLATERKRLNLSPNPKPTAHANYGLKPHHRTREKATA